MAEPGAATPHISISDSSTSANRTGSWKYIRPVYRDGVAPCNHACPAGIDVEGYMNLLRQGRIEEALNLLARENPMPAVTGRVCHHPCETSCNRRALDGAVSVHAVERALGDAWLERPHPVPPKRRRSERVAVVGSGPAGLGAAWHLARMGYGVVVYDEADEAGGMLRHGIPGYRLPRPVLDRQIDRIRASGVEIRTGARLEGEAGRAELDPYQAVLFAVGAHRGRATGADGEDGPGVRPGLAFLKAVNRGERPAIGPRVAVVGGGNTAMDCARTALRLGAHPIVVYRRTRAEMPAIAQEVEEALAEGVELMFLAAPRAYLHEAGRLVGIELERMELGDPDATGRRRPVPVKGRSFTLDVDTVLTAIGEEPELDAVPDEVSRHAGAIRVDALGATGITTFFAAGDAAGAERTVADALGSGKRAAIGIDRYLRWVAGERVRWGDVSELQWAGGGVSISRWYGDDPVRRTDPTDEVIDVAALQLAHFAPAARHPDRFREGELDFSEVNLGLDLEAAVVEARRCFNCGVCNDCELCLIFCPDVAIRRLPAGGFEIDTDHCKGCGLCAEECPRGAIVMTREAL